MGERPGVLRRVVPWLLALALYVGFTLYQTWPLVRHLPDVFASDLGDPVLNTWILWWNAHTRPFTAQWWNAPAFWPSNGSLAFSEVLLGLTPLTTPIQWMGGSAITAYNVAFLITFPLSAIAAHALVFRLTRRHDAAMIGALIYGFNPFRIAHFPQIQVNTSYWMPLALLGLHAYLDDRRARWLVLFGACWLMQAMSNGYYLLFFPVLVGLWIAWFAVSWSNLRALLAIGAAWVIASLPLIPLLWKYRQIHQVYNFQRDVGAVASFGADVTSLLDASPLMRFWTLQSFHKPEGELFPGFTAALLAFVVLVRWLWTSERMTRVPKFTLALLAVSVIFIGVAVWAIVFGPWSIVVGKTMLVSVKDTSKPLSIGVMLFVLALALMPRVFGGWQRRSPLMFYVLAMGAMYLLCFGPRPHFLGAPFMARGPYGLLMLLPGYDSIRVPARFAMLAALCLSVVASFAFVRLTAAISRPWQWGLAVVVLCGIVVDSAISEMPLQTPPPRLRTIETLSTPGAVLELPVGEIFPDAEAMYRGMYHARPVVNGYSGFFPKSYDVLRHGFNVRDPQMFDLVAAAGPLVVAVDTKHDDDGRWVKQLTAHPQAVFIGEEAGRKIFTLPASGPPVDVTSAARRLAIRSVTANVHDEHMRLAIDGNEDTRWDSGAQTGQEVVTIDLGATHFVDAVRMTIGSHHSDFPRDLVIESSEDGTTWTPRWHGSSASVTFMAAVRQPKQMPLTFVLPHVAARLLRLRQLGSDPVFYWSIFELTVLGG